MYAIVEIAGKQYKVEKDKTIAVDLLQANNDETVTIDKVMMLVDGDKVLVGQPYLSNVQVKAKVGGKVRGQKVRGIKFRKRKNYTRTLGHKQPYTSITIVDMSVK
jgi:large subunit ribosomal protein L21